VLPVVLPVVLVLAVEPEISVDPEEEVWARDPHRRARLAEEPRDRLLVARELREQELAGHASPMRSFTAPSTSPIPPRPSSRSMR